MNLELKKFDMKNISFKANEASGPVIVLIGRRDTGKSFWLEICCIIIRISLLER